MSLTFKCNNCGEKIIVRFLKPGEKAMCRSCSAKNTIPAVAAHTDEQPAYIKSNNGKPRLQINRRKLPPYIKIAGEVYTIAIALIFYAINLHLSLFGNDYVLIFQIPLIGRMILLPALIRLRKFDLGWPLYALWFVTPMFMLFDISMLIGMNLNFYVWFTPLELVLILCLLRKAVSSVGGLEHLISTTTAVLYLEAALFAVSFVLGILFVLVFMFQMQVSDNTRHLAMMLVGSLFFSFLIGFVMSALLIFVAIKVKRGIKGLLPTPEKLAEQPPDTQPKWF